MLGYLEFKIAKSSQIYQSIKIEAMIRVLVLKALYGRLFADRRSCSYRDGTKTMKRVVYEQFISLTVGTVLLYTPEL